MPHPTQHDDVQPKPLQLGHRAASFRVTRRTLIKSILAAGSGLVGWTVLIEPAWLQVTFHALTIPNLPDHWKGKRLVQISDLHIGQTSTSHLQRAMQQVNRLEPDVLVVTGDIIDRHFDDKKLFDIVLGEIKPAKIATLGCLGNHDYGKAWQNTRIADQVVEGATRHGIRMLRNEKITIDGFAFIGLDDYWAPSFDPQPVLNQAFREAPSICLCHNPDVYDLCDWSRFQGLILSGHTHGGQCKPPFLPPPRLPVQNRKYTAGFFDLAQGNTMYINRGLGYSLRARFNCRPEISVFELS